VSKPFIALLAALAAISMIAAGCGGGSDSTDSTSSLTKAEFVKQGNAICAKGNKEIQEGFEEFEKEHGSQKQPTKAELSEAVETIVLPAVRQQVEGVKALPAPSGEEAEVEAITDAAEEALEQGEEDPASLTTEKADPFAKANELANEYGLTKCGEE
jgi:hypothetical protein